MNIINNKLKLKSHQRSAEIAIIKDKIDKLNLAQNNLTSSLEAGIATDTIMQKLQKNEDELASLKSQLEAKKGELSTIDDDTYNELVKRFVNYMGKNKTPQAADLRNAAIDRIEVSNDKTTIYFNHGIGIDEETKKYFDNEKNWEALS